MKRSRIVNFFGMDFVRFIGVGLVNTAFSYSVYSILIYFHFPYLIAGIGQIFLGIIFNFKTIGKFVFSNNDNRLLIKFTLGYGVVAVVYLVSLKFFHTVLPNGYTAGALAIIPQALLSFIINKIYIFKNGKK